MAETGQKGGFWGAGKFYNLSENYTGVFTFNKIHQTVLGFVQLFCMYILLQ